jgi:PDDEXK-like domain of unknown function (DUF3799)
MKTIKWDGEPISKPGVYSGISLEQYHSADICDGPSISSSGLRTIFNESPAHFYADWSGNPKRKTPKDNRALIIGSAVHHLVLGQPMFARNFAVQPLEYEAAHGEMKPWNNNAGDCKSWHRRMKKEGRLVLLPKELPNIEGMATTLGMNPIVRAGALNGAVERSIFWKDEKTGIWLKTRPDTIPGDSGDFVDLKTTISVKWYDLVRTIGDFSYHQQGALNLRAARELLKIDHPSFSLIFVEKEDPWCVEVVTLKDNDLARGDKQNRAAIDTFVRCLKSGHWPGPGGEHKDAQPIELSEREQKRIDTELLTMGEA